MAWIYRATLLAEYSDGTLVEPGIDYQTDVPVGGDEPDPNDVATVIHNHFTTVYRNTLPSTVKYKGVLVHQRVLKPDIGVSGAHNVDLDGTGFAGTGDLPRALVPLIAFHTGVASKSARGHCFLCGPGTEASTSGGLWDTSGAQPFYDAFADAVPDTLDMGSFFATQLRPGVYSTKRHKAGETPFFFRITSATARTRPTWLRSRLTTP